MSVSQKINFLVKETKFVFVLKNSGNVIDGGSMSYANNTMVYDEQNVKKEIEKYQTEQFVL